MGEYKQIATLLFAISKDGRTKMIVYNEKFK